MHDANFRNPQCEKNEDGQAYVLHHICRIVQPTCGPERSGPTSGMFGPFSTPQGPRKQRPSTWLVAAFRVLTLFAASIPSQ